ncbi:MAG: hypothetical protein ACRDSP_00055 [Pseudonocardiaceae bacterium]
MTDPTRPGDIPHGVGLRQLVDQMEEHRTALFFHRHGGAPLDGAALTAHCLADLAYGAALSERVLYGRWLVAVDALNAGASHDQVASAMGLDVDELIAGLRAWAHGQLRYGLMTPARHAEVLALLGEGGGGHE